MSSSSNSKQKTPAPPPQPPTPAPQDGPLDVEGGKRSPVDGKFEADHRPSR